MSRTGACDDRQLRPLFRRWGGRDLLYGALSRSAAHRDHQMGPRSLGVAPERLVGASFALDVGGFQDRPPLVDLGLVELSKALRRLLLARRNVEPELGQAGADRWIGQRFDHRAIQF